MKSNIKKFGLYLIAIMAISFTSCNTDDDVCSTDDEVVIVITEETAVEIITSSLAYNTYGMASNVNYVSDEISTILNCDEQATNSGTNNFTSVFGNVTSIYQFNEFYSKTCVPSEVIEYSITAFQDTDAVYFTSQENVEADFTVVGLDDTSTNEIYSGSYHREGNWFSKSFNDSFDVEYDMNFSDLYVNKTSYNIVSGISSFSMAANYSETSESTSFNGTVTFLNEGEAQLDFNNGSSYLLNLETGEISLI